MNRKTRRMFEKLNRKKNMTIAERNEFLSQNGESTISVSFCPDHGPYTPDNLCACYDKGGSHEGVNYEDIVLRNSAAILMASCPIHGSYAPDNLCDCYDKNGELKPDWDKNLVDSSTKWS